MIWDLQTFTKFYFCYIIKNVNKEEVFILKALIKALMRLCKGESLFIGILAPARFSRWIPLYVHKKTLGDSAPLVFIFVR